MIPFSTLFLYMAAGAILLMLVLLILISAALPGISLWSKRYFTVVFLLLALCMASAIADVTFQGRPGFTTPLYIIVNAEYLLFSAMYPMFTLFILHNCAEDWRHSKVLGVVLGLCAALVLLLVVNGKTGCFFSVTPESRYLCTPWYPLLMTPALMALLVNMVALHHRRNRFPQRYYHVYLVFLFLCAGFVVTDMYTMDIMVSGFAVGLSTIVMFTRFSLTHVQSYLRQRRELSHQQANVMVLQMRPHFIYNAMTSVYYLCEQDPKKAQQVTLNFITYLRKNFDAIASENPIPFSEELAHARAYLAVEQAQFDDRLIVDYDTPHTQFSLPPLTLQPLVENAVKHGMDPDGKPLHIVVRTRKTERGNMVIVEDDGIGFDAAHVFEKPTALSNIRQRLALMCAGSITITPRAGGGTVVTVKTALHSPAERQNCAGGAARCSRIVDKMDSS